MKRSRFYSFASFVSAALLAASCEAILPEEPEEPAETLQNTSTLSLRINYGEASKSSISPDEDQVSHLYVMAYRKEDGRLMATQSGKSASDIEMELTEGDYNIYVTANMEGFEAPADEGSIASSAYMITSFTDMGKALPMCWHGEATLKAGEKTTVFARLSRLVSKVGLSVEMGVLEGLDIVSVRLRQGAGCLRPFMDGGSRILTEEEALDGDFATEEDISRLMAGEDIFFYVTENCQGKLLEGNDDPWKKVPESIDEASGLCTYIEMTGEWDEDAFYAGKVTYRFYLGEDAVSDFNVKGNSIHNLTLYLEEESFGKISWKIDPTQMELVQWEAVSSFENNFHSHDEFYVTENILMEFTLDKRGQKYWEKLGYDFSLAGESSQGRTIIRFNDPTDLGNGRFQALGTCLRAGDYDVLIINNETGDIEYVLASGTVHVPEIVASYDDVFTDKPVDEFDTVSEFTINGGYNDICLYLTDKDGYNLNQGHFYGCDLSICDWEVGIINEAYGHDLYDNATVEVFHGESQDDSYAARYRISFKNDGKNLSWNRMLTESLGTGAIRLAFKDHGSGAEGSHGLGLYCDDIDVRFTTVPDANKYTLQTEFMYVVSNPSNLPLIISGLKLNSMRLIPDYDNVHPILWHEVEGYTSTAPLHVSRMVPTYCSLDSNGMTSMTYGGELCFGAQDCDIEQHDIPNQTSMFHTLDVRLAYPTTGWTPRINGSVNLYPNSNHSIIYGKQGYVNCGVVFHTYDTTRELFDSNNGLYTDFTEYGDMLGKDALEKFIRTIELTVTINEDNELVATSSREATLDISVSGVLHGHTRCASVQQPKLAVWGHYFRDTQKFSSRQTIKVGSEEVVIDRSLAESFEDMREIEYYSMLNAYDIEQFRTGDDESTTIREYLKPYDLEMTLEITSADGSPVALKFSGETTYEHELSDPVTWPLKNPSTVTMVPSAFARLDYDLDDYDCPPGYMFIDETVKLTPRMTYGNPHDIYYMIP